MVEDRLNARFFDAVKTIDKQDFAGFAVLALDLDCTACKPELCQSANADGLSA
jgi:hypothetical protein